MIRVFPRKTKWTPTDDLAFVGDPPIIGRPLQQTVNISCVFTWDKREAERLFYSWLRFYSDVRIDGPAYGDPGDEFEPGLFLKEGVTITSRGCPKDCPWCFVPQREGMIREYQIHDGWDIQDNNLLACSFDHVKRVFEMLSRQKHRANFRGGLDADFLTEKHVDLFDTVKFDELWFACDHNGAIENIRKVSELLAKYPRNKKRCFVLVGFNEEPIEKAEKRLMTVWDLGFLPFAMKYRNDSIKKEHITPDWQRLIKTFSRPAATKSEMKKRNAI